MSDMNDVCCTIKGDLMWVKNFVEDQDYPGTYKVDVCNLSDAAVEGLKAIGLSGSLRPKPTDDPAPEKGAWIRLASNKPIPTYDDDGKLMESETNFIGNGSKGIARAWAFTVTRKGTLFGRVSAKCLKLHITELVENTGTMDEEEAL
jgi:hypothetical protein